MPELLYPDEIEVQAPILLTKQNLLDLDVIITEYNGRLTARQREKLEEEVDKQAREYGWGNLPSQEQEQRKAEAIGHLKNFRQFRQAESSIVIRLKSGRRLKASSFAEIVAHEEVTYDTPIGFEACLAGGEVELGVATPRYRNNELAASVRLGDDSTARDMLAAVKGWTRTIEAPRWQRIWVSLNGLQWLVFFFSFIFALAVAGNNSSEALLRAQGRELVANGVSADNQLKAIETILGRL